MKILKIFGIVVGIHVFALLLIFVNPGCSSTTTPPLPTDTAAPPMTGAPTSTRSGAMPSSPSAPSYPAPAITFNPDAPAVAASGVSETGRFTPTRPGSPVAGTLIAEPVVDVMPATTYTVKSGDNLWSIAKKNNISTAQLAAANNLKTDVNLRPGQKLLIPGKPASPAAAAAAKPSVGQGKTAETVAVRPAASAGGSSASGSGALKHVVKTGESLSTIARAYGVPSREIAVANNITDPAKIKAGTELVIPGWDPTPGAKSGKSGSSKAAPSSSKAAPSTPPVVNAEPPQQQDQPPPAPPSVPVIRMDQDSPILPAPKSR